MTRLEWPGKGRRAPSFLPRPASSPDTGEPLLAGRRSMKKSARPNLPSLADRRSRPALGKARAGDSTGQGEMIRECRNRMGKKDRWFLKDNRLAEAELISMAAPPISSALRSQHERRCCDRPATLPPYPRFKDVGQWFCVPYFRNGLPFSGLKCVLDQITKPSKPRSFGSPAE
jgi:hypothetical protein